MRLRLYSIPFLILLLCLLPFKTATAKGTLRKKKLAIIGHGVAGFAISQLAKDVYDVTTFERASAPLMGTSKLFWKMHDGREYTQHDLSARSCHEGLLAWRAAIGEAAYEKITFGATDWYIVAPSNVSCVDLNRTHHYLRALCKNNTACAKMPDMSQEVQYERFVNKSLVPANSSHPRVECRMAGISAEKNINRSALLEYIEEQSENITRYYNVDVVSVSKTPAGQYKLSYDMLDAQAKAEVSKNNGDEMTFDFVVDATGAWAEDKFQDANVRLMIKLTFPPHVSASELEVMTSNGGPGTSFYSEGLSGGMAVRYDPGRGRAIEIFLFRPGDNYLKGRSSKECRDGLCDPNEPILPLEEYRSKGEDPELQRRIIDHHRWLDPALGRDIDKYHPMNTSVTMPLASDNYADPRKRAVLSVKTVEPGYFYAPLAKGTHAFLLAAEVMRKMTAAESKCEEK